MMSAADDPTLAGKAASATVTIGTPSPSGDGDNQDDDGHKRKQLWRFLWADLTFMTSIIGMFWAGEIILSLLALISVSVPKNQGCAYLFSSRYSYFEFTSSSCFITSGIWYCLYVFGVNRKLRFIRWDIGEMVVCIFFAFNYLISSAVLADAVCGQGGYKAAAAFGFLCLFVVIGHGVFVFKDVYTKYKEGKSVTYGPGSGETSTAAEEEKY